MGKWTPNFSYQVELGNEAIETVAQLPATANFAENLVTAAQLSIASDDQSLDGVADEMASLGGILKGARWDVGRVLVAVSVIVHRYLDRHSSVRHVVLCVYRKSFAVNRVSAEPQLLVVLQK